MPLLRSILLCASLTLFGCVSVTLTARESKGHATSPILVLVNQGGYDLKAANDLKAELEEQLRDRSIAAQLIVVTSEVLKRQQTIDAARAKAKSLLRIMPIAGTHLEGVASRITYDVALHESTTDRRLWQARVEVRSGIVGGQLERRQRRAARKIVEAMVEAGAI